MSHGGSHRAGEAVLDARIGPAHAGRARLAHIGRPLVIRPVAHDTADVTRLFLAQDGRRHVALGQGPIKVRQGGAPGSVLEAIPQDHALGAVRHVRIARPRPVPF